MSDYHVIVVFVVVSLIIVIVIVDWVSQPGVVSPISKRDIVLTAISTVINDDGVGDDFDGRVKFVFVGVLFQSGLSS